VPTRRSVTCMPLRRAIPVLRYEYPEQTRGFFVDFLGFEAAVDEPGFMMLVSPDAETTQLIVGDASVSAEAADKLRDVDVSVDSATSTRPTPTPRHAAWTSSTRSPRSPGGRAGSWSGCRAGRS
jgi:hypothetical protein